MNNALNVAKELANMQPKLQDGDYIKDDLFYCGECNTPKQYRCNILGKEKIVTCLCRCQADLLKQQNLKAAENERKLYIERLKSKGIQDKQILQYTFANDNNSNPKITSFMKRYVECFDEMYKTNTGLLLWGDVGNGKTFSACCIGNALLSKSVPVMITDFTKMLNKLQGMRDNRLEFIEEFNHYKLLIFDDFGAERSTDYALEQILYVVDQRYKNKQPVIFTTNLSVEEIKNPKDASYSRIYDRVLEMCVPVKFNGESKRNAKAKEKYKTAERILFNNTL
ncbi:MAG: ATP-binding protein [Aminipila sp.]